MPGSDDGPEDRRSDRESYLSDEGRLDALARTKLIDSGIERSFDRLVLLATRLFRAPVAIVSLVDARRQFFKSSVGLPEPWAGRRETTLAHSFCQHVVSSREALVIPDARVDPRVQNCLAIPDLNVIAYLGVPLLIDGEVLGAFAVIDGQVRAWTDDDLGVLRDLADSVTAEIRLRIDQDEIARHRLEAEGARRELDDTQLRLEDALSAGSVATFAWDIPNDRVVGDANMARFYSISPAEAAGGPVANYVQAIDLEDRARVAEGLGRAVSDGGTFAEEYRVNRGDGPTRWVFARGNVRLDGAGSPLRMTGVVVDITEKKEVEARDRHRTEQAQRLAQISTQLNATHDHQSLLCMVTHEARALFSVHQSVAGLSGDGADSPSASHVSLADHYDAWEDHAEPFEEGGLADHVCRTKRSLRLAHDELELRPEWLRFHADNPSRPPLKGWLAAPLIARNGDALGLIHLSDKHEGEFTADDEAILVQLAAITAVAIENARLLEELRDNDRRKDEFLAMLAHELRNPLAAISGGVKLAQDAGAPGDFEAIREMIDRQAGHLARLIDDLLDVSRIATGKIILKKQAVTLGEIIDRAVDQARPLVAAKRHELTIAAPDREALLVADPTRAGQILGNLLANAAKYTEPGGRIHLDARIAGAEVVLKVRDNGVGIPREMLSRVFGLFAQVDSSIDRSQGGLGIGLTLVRNLAEMHGGRATAASDGPGRGSEFVVVLPVGEPAAATKAPAPRPDRAGPIGGRILVVDDNRDTARMTARLLSKGGYEVRSAHDGHEAVRAAGEFLPHIVLLDIGLPGMNGYEVAAALREDERCRDAMIVAVSGYGEAGARDRSRASGFDHHLTKPLDFDHLQEIIGDPARGFP